ncbi:MAG: hypothetical protein JW885_02475 [Deltaproteobacteria bacterium]|nr:hypothetical protein [Candidatus Zymogenaceae bacterium]
MIDMDAKKWEKNQKNLPLSSFNWAYVTIEEKVAMFAGPVFIKWKDMDIFEITDGMGDKFEFDRRIIDGLYFEV